MPVSIKDLIFTRRLRTAAGSRLLADHVPEEDAVAVERLRGAGAIIVGKTNTPEFGFKGVTDSPLFGPTRNPWDHDAHAGRIERRRRRGGGGGPRPPRAGHRRRRVHPHPRLVLRNLRAQALLRARALGARACPAGRPSRTPGPMTRTVRDAALMLDVLAGPDDRDRHSLPAAAGAPYPRRVRRRASPACPSHGPPTWATAGSTPKWPISARRRRRASSRSAATSRWWCRPGTTPRRSSARWRAGEAFAAYRDRLEAGERLLDPALVELLRFGETITAERYLTRAPRAGGDFWTEVQRFLARFDLLITPTVAVAPFALDALPIREIAGSPVSPLGWTPFTFPFNLTGQPAASVPAGFTASGLPVGLQIVGRRHADRTVLAASAAWEAAAPWQARRPAGLSPRVRSPHLPRGGARHGARYAVGGGPWTRRVSLRYLAINAAGSFLIGVIQQLAFATPASPRHCGQRS